MKPRLQNRLAARHKQLRRKQFARKLVLVVVGALCVAVLVGIFSVLKKFTIHTVSVSGEKRVSESDIKASVEGFLFGRRWYILPERNFLVTDTARLETALKNQFSTIREVHATKDLQGSLRIEVSEYDPWGVLCHTSDADCYWIDRGGVAFEKAPSFNGLIVPKVDDRREYRLELGKRYLSDALMGLITFWNEKALDDHDLQSLSFSIDAKDQTLRLTTRTGWQILLLESNNPEETYTNLRLALRTQVKDQVGQLEYVDLRFGNRVFYKVRDGSGSTSATSTPVQ